MSIDAPRSLEHNEPINAEGLGLQQGSPMDDEYPRDTMQDYKRIPEDDDPNAPDERSIILQSC